MSSLWFPIPGQQFFTLHSLHLKNPASSLSPAGGSMTQMGGSQPGKEQKTEQSRQRHLLSQRPGGRRERGTFQEPGPEGLRAVNGWQVELGEAGQTGQLWWAPSLGEILGAVGDRGMLND